MMKEINTIGCKAFMFEMKNGRQKSLKIRSNSADSLRESITVAQRYILPYGIKLGIFDFQVAFQKKRKILDLTKNFKAFADFDIKNNTINIYQMDKNQRKEIVNTILTEIRKTNMDTIILRHLKPIIGNKGQALKHLQEKYEGRVNFDYKQKTISLDSDNKEEIIQFKTDIKQ